MFEHSFLAAPITPGSTIVDLGANSGGFATKMISAFGCAVVGVEPVPQLFASIPKTPGLTVQQLAVSDTGEPVTLFLNDSSLAATIDADLAQRDVPTIEVPSTTLEQILDAHDIAHTPLVKVDIEGAELGMLRNASVSTLQRADQFTIEFHDFIYAEQARPVAEVKDRLRDAGFVEMRFSSNNSDVLFVNASRIPFTAAHRAAAAIAYKYPRGIVRNLQRRLRDRRAAANATN